MNDAPSIDDGHGVADHQTRFTFGKNWAAFLKGLDDAAIEDAVASLQEMLGVESLAGKTFLDIGSGSGLFSLAARRLGGRVLSFDYDRESCGCTETLKRRFFAGDPAWTVERGDILDRSYVESLGSFDVVYAWGVLHHTGAIWAALDHARLPVRANGTLFIAIYNFQTRWTAFYTVMKRAYVRSPILGKVVIAGAYIGFTVTRSFVFDLARLRSPISRYRVRNRRGMSLWHDWIDWIGGYPFEAATPEEVFDFYRQHGFTLVRLTTVGGGSSNNQFVFRRTA